MTSTMRLWHSALLFILASAVAVPQATAASGWNFVKRKFSQISYIFYLTRETDSQKKAVQFCKTFELYDLQLHLKTFDTWQFGEISVLVNSSM